MTDEQLQHIDRMVLVETARINERVKRAKDYVAQWEPARRKVEVRG